MSDDKPKGTVGGSARSASDKPEVPQSVGGSAKPAEQPLKMSTGKAPAPGKEPDSAASLATPKLAARPGLQPMSSAKPTGAPTPAAPGINAEQIALTVVGLQTTYNDYLNRVNFPGFERRIMDISNRITELPTEIAGVRRRGYAFRSFLENKAQVLAQQWQENQGRIQETIRAESQALRQELEQADSWIQRLGAQAGNVATQSQIVPSLQNTLDSLGPKVQAAENLIEGMYASLERELHQTRSQLDEIKRILDWKEEASFSFGPTESVFMAAEAEWADGNDTPNGLLFLTDQRLVFEQKEKTGKTLGLFGGKAVQEVKWETPLNAIQSVEAENKGLLGGKDILNLTLGAGATYGKLTVEVKGGMDCKLWARQIRRMMSGDAQDERALEPDPELIERLRNAPTSCHICGGTLPQITTGQTSVTCAYCGVVIRI